MVILQGILALLAGFAVMTVPVVALTVWLTRSAPNWVGPTGRPRPAYMLVNAAYSVAAAVAGGYVTAMIASENPLRYTLGLAIVVLGMSAISALEGRGRQPLRYRVALIVLMPVGVVLGGLLRLHVMGVQWGGFE
jgi:hypothetical protein